MVLEELEDPDDELGDDPDELEDPDGVEAPATEEQIELERRARRRIEDARAAALDERGERARPWSYAIRSDGDAPGSSDDVGRARGRARRDREPAPESPTCDVASAQNQGCDASRGESARDRVRAFDRRRSGRKHVTRSFTISLRASKASLEALGMHGVPPLEEGEREQRPRTRSECVDGERPCPWVSCRHHLYLDVDPKSHGIKLNFPDVDVLDMVETCSLDVAERGGTTLERVAELMNLTRERVRQIEIRALRNVQRNGGERFSEHAPEGGPWKRRLPMVNEDEEQDTHDEREVENG